MLEGNHIYSVISLIVGVLMLCLALYVFGLNREMKIANAFIASMCFGSFAAVLDFLLLNIPDGETALMLARMASFFTVCMFGGFLYIAVELPYENGGHWIMENRTAYLLLVGLSGLIPSLSINETELNSFGWGIPTSDFGFWVWIFVLVFYMVVTVFTLTQVGMGSQSHMVRRQCALMSVAISIPFLYSFTTESLNRLLELGSPPLLAPGFLLTAILFTVVVVRTKMFIVEPVKEEVRVDVTKKVPSIPVGSCKLLEGKKSDMAYVVFTGEVAAGSQGILITRVHPDQIKERYGLVKTPIIWLTSQPGQLRIDPSSLSILQHTIIDFMQKGSKTVVLLDGLEYLISNNGVDKVIRIVYSLKDTAVTTGSKFIIPLDPEVLGEKELALFERELDVEKMDTSTGIETRPT